MFAIFSAVPPICATDDDKSLHLVFNELIPLIFNIILSVTLNHVPPVTSTPNIFWVVILNTDKLPCTSSFVLSPPICKPSPVNLKTSLNLIQLLLLSKNENPDVFIFVLYAPNLSVNLISFG